MYIAIPYLLSTCMHSSKPAPPERIPWAKLRAEQADREAAKWAGNKLNQSYFNELIFLAYVTCM